MTFIHRLIGKATEAAANRREQRDLASILRGPDSAFRSELIDAMSTRSTYRP